MELRVEYLAVEGAAAGCRRAPNMLATLLVLSFCSDVDTNDVVKLGLVKRLGVRD